MMLYILKANVDTSLLKEKLNRSSASYKFLNLYGKNLLLVWPDQYAKDIVDDSIEIAVNVRKSYVLSSNDWKKEPTIVRVKDTEIGGNKIVVAAGPCAVESEEQLSTAAKGIKRAGASLLRGGAYKPRTSPYSFQGLGEEGVKLLRKVG
ncbi:3-deoxy-7-phosphoheptulonate synthase, partial [Sulfolobus sp. A20-N-G8]